MSCGGLYCSPAAEQLVPTLRQQLYGRELRGSVSQLEKFAVCPRAYFASYGLKLEEREEYTVTPIERGNLFHAVLEWVGRKVAERGIPYAAIDEARAEALVEEAFAEIVPQFLGGILLSGGRYDYLLARSRRALISMVAETAQLLATDGFVPVAWEQSFGRGENSLPYLVLDLPGDRKVKLRGIIDRIDIKKDEFGTFARVIDYKTGKVEIRLRDVFSGRRLQLLTYLQVVAQNAQRFACATPDGGYYQLLHDDLKKVDSAAGDAPPLKLSGIKKADKDAAMEILPQILRETATALMDGEIAPHPLDDGDSCSMCAYRDFCGFDRELCRPRRPLKPEDVQQPLNGGEDQHGV